MALVVKDRVRENSTTTGTGTLTLTGAVSGFQTFSSAIGNTETTYYAIVNNTEWEIGIGTVGAGTLTRDTVLESSNGGTKVNLSAGTKDVFCTYPAELSVSTDKPNTFTANQIVSVTDNVNAALRITQTGTGNALVVEDSTSPDSTPFVIDANGRIVTGTTSVLAIGSDTPNIQVFAGSNTNNGFGNYVFAASASSSNFNFAKTRSTTYGAFSVVANNDSLGKVKFYGDDGSKFVEATRIESLVDGTPGTNDMPGRLVFSTTADGASTPTERMRITSAGNVGIGTTNPTERLDVSGTVKANVLSATNGMMINSNTVSSSYTIPTDYNAMSAGNVVINSGVTVTIPSGSRWVIV
jgi:hypothetical protein